MSGVTDAAADRGGDARQGNRDGVDCKTAWLQDAHRTIGLASRDRCQ